MRKLFFKWLFDVDDIADYGELLREVLQERRHHLAALNDHIETLNERSDDLELMRKLLKICENHGIDVDQEIKDITLE